MLPNLGVPELVVIMGVALVIFGPKKLPEIGKGIGNAMREFNKARNDFMDSINAESDRDEPRPAPAHSLAADTNSDGYSGTERSLEYPQPLEADSADALPYGSDFQTEGDSQPAFRTAQPAATSAAPATQDA